VETGEHYRVDSRGEIGENRRREAMNKRLKERGLKSNYLFRNTKIESEDLLYQLDLQEDFKGIYF